MIIPQFIEFNPPENIRKLIASMISSSELKSGLNEIKRVCSDDLKAVGVNSFIQQKVSMLEISLSDECDKPDQKKFGQTFKKDKQVCIQVSRRFWRYYERTNDHVIGFLFAVTVVHEIAHAFIRSGGLMSTPKKLCNSCDVDDAGYLIERHLFSGIRLSGNGLQLFANCKFYCKWFPSKAILKDCRLGIYRHRKKTWRMLPNDYIEQLVTSGQYSLLDSDHVNVLPHAPGNIHIAGRADTDDEMDSKRVEISFKPPGNICFERRCIWARGE
jgi:hypothetical protein